MAKTAIIFGSGGGATENIANFIAKKMGGDVAVLELSKLVEHDLTSYSNLIFGASTLRIGDLHNDWINFLPTLTNINLQQKNIAIYGLGNSLSYPDSFVDGMGTIYEAIKNKGCNIIGFVDTEGYSFMDSKAVYNGQFVGLALDEENERDLSEHRLNAWLAQILPVFN